MAAITSNKSSKRLPKDLVDLLDVAIFTFGCQSGLRSTHKVRGDPVLEGVSAFFGQLICTANEQVQAKFEEISSSRLGGWQPGKEPSNELLKWVSSRIRTLKEKDCISRDTNPTVPSLLRRSGGPVCWRCKQYCRFCSESSKSSNSTKRKKCFSKFGNFRIE